MEGGDLTWRKSSRSGDNGGACVEVATLPDRVMVRDSKDPDPDRPHLAVTPSDWHRFVASLRR